MAGASAAWLGVLVLGARKGKYGPNGEVVPFLVLTYRLRQLGYFHPLDAWFGFNGVSVLEAW